MTIYQCDRCGEQIGLTTGRPPLIARRQILDRTPERIDAGERPLHLADLCDKCWEELGEWLKPEPATATELARRPPEERRAALRKGAEALANVTESPKPDLAGGG